MLSAFISKASISAYGMGSLHVLEGTLNAERYQQHGFVVEESGAVLACLQSRSFSYREHLSHHYTKKYVNDDHKLFSSWKPISGKNGSKFQHQNSRNS